MNTRSTYDAVAGKYASTYFEEWRKKPPDERELRRFAQELTPGPVADLGCGPGSTTAFLAGLGVKITGYDLSPQLIAEARRLYPHVPFETADMRALPMSNDSLDGIIAFYSLVHFQDDERLTVFREWQRTLRPGGRVLFTVHIGDGPLTNTDFLGSGIALDFHFHQPGQLVKELNMIGFSSVEVIEREAIPGVEFASRRAYLRAVKSNA